MLKKRMVKLLVVLAAIYFIFKFLFGLSAGCGGASTEGTELLVNHPWIERMPKDPRDSIHGLILVERGRRLGAASHGSLFRYSLDMLGWKASGDSVELLFLQDERKESFHYRAWKCKGEAPKPFDLCLELESRGKHFKMYSRGEWRQRDADELPAELTALFGAVDSAPEGGAVECPSCASGASAWSDSALR